MNKIYRNVWNEITRTWVAVAEIVKAHGRAGGVVGSPPGLGTLVKPLVLALACIGTALAAPPNPPASNQLPTGGNVVAGSAIISQAGSTLNVTQTTNRAAVDWQTFNVGSQAQVNFIQPSSSSAILNRVLDPNPSQIFGRVTANGQVFLTNASGIYFAPGASVNVGALTATTHSISNADFMAGNLKFTRNGATGKIENEGTLTADLNGYVALLAPEVRNSGVIVAQLGTVALAAGEAYELQFDNGRMANIRVEPATIAALVENKNAVQAPGGLIILSALAANRLQGGVINNTGSLEAAGLTDNGGTIRLAASDRITHTGSINVNAAPNSTGNGGAATLIADLANKDSVAEINGTISARGGNIGGDGGFVETSGGRLKIGSSTQIDTRASQGKSGTWLLDPDGFTIAASGGDMDGTTLGNNVTTNGDVIIQSTSGSGSDGNINVNDNVSWSANKLTLQATNDININAVMTASGTASLDLAAGSNKVNTAISGNAFTGKVDWTSSGTLRMNVAGSLQTFTAITDIGALQAINNNRAGYYFLANTIDASATSGWNAGAGFLPIGNDGFGQQFTGVLDGLGHTVTNLTINRSSQNNIGLIGMAQGNANAELRNIGVTGSSVVTGNNSVGSLAGYFYGVEIANTFSTFWLTGLSGAGKTTLARALADSFDDAGVGYRLLDGDIVRRDAPRKLGFCREDRRVNIHQAALRCHEINQTGLHAIAAFISPYQDDRSMAMSIVGEASFREIHVATPLEICEARDPKGLYRRARAGEIRNFTGLDDPYEPPLNPALVLNTEQQSVAECVALLLELLEN